MQNLSDAGSGFQLDTPSKMGDFVWTKEYLEKMVLSTVYFDKDNSKNPTLILPHKGPMRPLKMFAAYKQFCKLAFVGGTPLPDCPIQCYEKQLLELLGPESDER
ncbi:hypothetical protein Ocin01_05941 [Orchesella cincta]|uniref:Uncharacterized protein n=1 Tax=Orchesella cincta TaxID=48709 RepID=A0A1D2N646_ORCCI|nr:hypothetical protein Ocin01_05941 [Orchesella cincta]